MKRSVLGMHQYKRGVLKLSRPGQTKRTAQAGFTLIEVLVALAIVSVALAALSRAMGLTVGNQAALEERVFATWVAEDELVKLHIQASSREESKQQVTQLQRTWVTEMQTEDTLIPEIKKVTMQVTAEGQKTPSATLVTVIGP